jgi:hypothetical protein
MADKNLNDGAFCTANEMPQFTQKAAKTSAVFFEPLPTQLTHENETFTARQPNSHAAFNRSLKTGYIPAVFAPSKSPRMKERNEVIKVACSARKSREVFTPIYEAVQRVTAGALAQMNRPVGVMVRFTLVTDSSPAKALQRVVERFTRASQNPSKPAYVWAREVREHDYEGNACQYDHYHSVLIIDRSSHWLATLRKALEALQTRGHIESFHISHDKQGLKVHDLSTTDGLQAFYWHASYLAKTDTKLHCTGRRIFGRSQVSAATSFKPTPKRPKLMQIRTADDKAIEATSRQRRANYLKRARAMLDERNQVQA